MSRANRRPQGVQGVLTSLEQERRSRVIVYYTSDKQPAQFAAVVANDVLPLFRKTLESFGETNKITLILDTAGGHLEAPWPLVNLIREYCNTFEVIVLEKALSAGTMIALGADRIVMMPYSHLSPIDPAANVVDEQTKQVKKVEIEDIIGYIAFAKDKVGLVEQGGLVGIMQELSKEVSPTLLGSINRTHALVRKLANDLLALHRVKLPDRQAKEIIEYLTQKLYSHRHFVNRREARNIGFGSIIEHSNETTKQLSEQLIEYFKNLMEIDKEFDVQALLGAVAERKVDLVRAVVYSRDIQYNFKSTYHIMKVPNPAGGEQIAVNNVKNGWTKD